MDDSSALAIRSHALRKVVVSSRIQLQSVAVVPSSVGELENAVLSNEIRFTAAYC